MCAALGLNGCGLLPFADDDPFHKSASENTKNEEAQQEATGEQQEADTAEADAQEENDQDESSNAEENTEAADTQQEESPLDQASLMAAQYNYDGAIELLKSQPDYDSNTDMQNAVS